MRPSTQSSCALFEYKKVSLLLETSLYLLCPVIAPTAPSPAPFTKRQQHMTFGAGIVQISYGMAPFTALLADGFPPNSSFPHAPQPKPIVSSSSNQNQWGPGSISTTVFGFLMFFMGIVALWQGRARRRRGEQGTACFHQRFAGNKCLR